ncbi:unnamed protein product [Bursaphelenchus okinawaensis]|uniref:Uncharacterized protein n=1 Tax=Bursaphelenchus okinawaensis TaxID=465554 RepID=A0A811L1B8_9BILA|nr:unnamed protein product [Bursaphelenchus okinawaensis]CAG9116894.1 unnamed protein product [Bursaphelenchus okinawaensis]
MPVKFNFELKWGDAARKKADDEKKKAEEAKKAAAKGLPAANVGNQDSSSSSSDGEDGASKKLLPVPANALNKDALKPAEFEKPSKIQDASKILSQAPGQKTGSPAQKPESPAQKPESPAQKPESPAQKPESPAQKPESPAQKDDAVSPAAEKKIEEYKKPPTPAAPKPDEDVNEDQQKKMANTKSKRQTRAKSAASTASVKQKKPSVGTAEKIVKDTNIESSGVDDKEKDEINGAAEDEDYAELREEIEKFFFFDYNPVIKDATSTVLFMTPGENVKSIFPSWHVLSNKYGVYHKYNANMPDSVPSRRLGLKCFKYDPPLTKGGASEAYRMAISMKRSRQAVTKIYSAPALACVETGSIIAKVLIDGGVNIEHGLDNLTTVDGHERFVYMSIRDFEKANYRVNPLYKSCQSPTYRVTTPITDEVLATRNQNTIDAIVKENRVDAVIVIAERRVIMNMICKLIGIKGYPVIDEPVIERLLPDTAVVSLKQKIVGSKNYDFTTDGQIVPFTTATFSNYVDVAEIKKYFTGSG